MEKLKVERLKEHDELNYPFFLAIRVKETLPLPTEEKLR
jgi:hypothetical protein